MKLLIALLALALNAQNPNTAAFPTTVATDTNLAVAKRLSQSTLSTSINNSITSVVVADGTQFLTQEIIRIDSEEMFISGISTNTLTVSRAFNSTSAASHTAGATVSGIITSWHHNQMAAEMKTVQARLRDATSGCADAGANDTYACSLTPPITAYVTGSPYRFKANTANTGAATINFNSVGAIALKKHSSSGLADLDTNDIVAGDWIYLIYNGTYMQVVGGVSSGGAWGTITGTLSAQTDLQAALDAKAGLTANNAMSGDNNFSGKIQLPSTTVASLPSAAANSGRIYVVTDASSGGSCTSGGAATKSLCRSDGSSWVRLDIQHSPGFGMTYGCSGPQCTIGLEWNDAGFNVGCTASTSSATAYGCTLPNSVVTTYNSGMLITFGIGSTACTGSTATTVNVDAVGAKRLYRHDGTSDPLSTECPANARLLLLYDATLNASAGGWRILGGNPPGSGSGDMVLATAQTSTAKKTFSPTASEAGAALICAALPSTPVNGDVACDSADSNRVKAYSNAAWVTIGGTSGATMAHQLGDLSVVRTSSTVLTVGTSCSTTDPCIVGFNGVSYAIVASAAITISAGSGTAYIQILTDGSLNVLHNVTISSCTGMSCAAAAGAAFTSTAIRLWTWTSTTGTWDVSGGNSARAFLSKNNTLAGTGLTVSSEGTGGTTLAVSTAVIPQYATSTTVPGSCASYGLFYFDTDAASGGKLYYCNGSTYEGIGASSGASAALDNLSGVSINTSLLAQTGVDLGSTAKPFRDLFLFGAGTYGTNYFRFTGTPTSTRTVTVPDVTGTAVVGATSTTATQAMFATATAGAPAFRAIATTDFPAASLVRTCEIVVGGMTGSALANGDDTPQICSNTTGATQTITAVSCYADAAGASVDVTAGGGGSTILTGAITCGTGSFAAGTLSGTPTVTNGNTLDANITTAGGTAKYIIIRITKTL